MLRLSFFPLAGDSLPCVNGKSSANLSAAAEEANSRRATILITIHKFLVHSICRQYKNRVAAGVSGGDSLPYKWTRDCWLCRSSLLPLNIFREWIFYASYIRIGTPREPRGVIHFNQEDESSLSPLSIACKHGDAKLFSFMYYITGCTRAKVVGVSWDFISLAFWICLLLKGKSKF